MGISPYGEINLEASRTKVTGSYRYFLIDFIILGNFWNPPPDGVNPPLLSGDNHPQMKRQIPKSEGVTDQILGQTKDFI